MLTRCSRTAGWPSTAPPWAPRDLDRVTVRTTWSRREMPARRREALPVVTGHAQPVRLVDEQHRVVAAGDRGELGQRGRVAEDGVDRLDQHHGPRLGPLGQQPLDGGDVVVGRPRPPGPGTGGRVDERGVHVGVGDDQGVGVGQGGDRAEVGVVAGREHQRAVGLQQAGERPLQLLVQRQRAGDQPGGAGPAAVRLRRGDRPGDHGRVPQQPEVVVAGQVQQAVGGGA